eukprot:3997940-Pyramimonas_sp.AAC.1
MQCEICNKLGGEGKEQEKKVLGVGVGAGWARLRHWSESRVLVDARSVQWCSSAVHASVSRA